MTEHIYRNNLLSELAGHQMKQSMDLFCLEPEEDPHLKVLSLSLGSYLLQGDMVWNHMPLAGGSSEQVAE